MENKNSENTNTTVVNNQSEINISEKSINELISLLKNKKFNNIELNENELEEISYEILKRIQEDTITLEDCLHLLNYNNDGINIFLLSSKSFLNKYIDSDEINTKNQIKSKIISIIEEETNDDETKEIIKRSAIFFLANAGELNNQEKGDVNNQVEESKKLYEKGGIIKEKLDINEKSVNKIVDNVIKEIKNISPVKDKKENISENNKENFSSLIRKISGLK